MHVKCKCVQKQLRCHTTLPFCHFQSRVFLALRRLRLQDINNTDNRLCKQITGIEYVNGKINNVTIGKSAKQCFKQWEFQGR